MVDEPSVIRNDDAITLSFMRQNRFTNDAVTVMLHTFDRALRQVNVGVVHPVLVLWSLLRWGYGMGIVALQESGIDQWSFERDTACLLEALNLPDEKELLFDFRAVSAVSTAAIIEAKMLERTYVDSDHILMALLRQEDDTLRTLFIKHGLTYENFKAKSRGILGGADEQKGGQEQKDRHVGLGFFVKCAPSTVRPKDGF